MIVTSFYKYSEIKEPEEFRTEHQKLCDSLGIKGKILVANEGINGCASGTPEQIEKYQQALNSDARFSEIKFKDTFSEDHPYKKMIVRVRPEIVTFGHDVDMSKKAEYVEPGKLREWIERQEVVLIDARNDYESRIGKFTGAITPKLDVFRDFPNVVKDFEAYKNKKIVTYCTGGIRCEKASAYLKQNGFENVYQLKDGILNYIEQFPDDYFEGRCFVFDFRLSVPSGKKNAAITACDMCHAPNDSYINCRNTKCDKMLVCCPECREKMAGTCSKACRAEFEKTYKGRHPGMISAEA